MINLVCLLVGGGLVGGGLVVSGLFVCLVGWLAGRLINFNNRDTHLSVTLILLFRLLLLLAVGIPLKFSGLKTDAENVFKMLLIHSSSMVVNSPYSSIRGL